MALNQQDVMEIVHEQHQSESCGVAIAIPFTWEVTRSPLYVSIQKQLSNAMLEHMAVGAFHRMRKESSTCIQETCVVGFFVVHRPIERCQT